jgi:hypothetical protein
VLFLTFGGDDGGGDGGDGDSDGDDDELLLQKTRRMKLPQQRIIVLTSLSMITALDVIGPGIDSFDVSVVFQDTNPRRRTCRIPRKEVCCIPKIQGAKQYSERYLCREYHTLGVCVCDTRGGHLLIIDTGKIDSARST